MSSVLPRWYESHDDDGRHDEPDDDGRHGRLRRLPHGWLSR